MFKLLTLESKISLLQILSSVLFMGGFIALLWFANYFLDNEHEFWLFFLMSICFFFICYPWTQKKQIVISDRDITFSEVIGPWLNKKEESIGIKNIRDLKLNSRGLHISDGITSYQLEADSFIVRETNWSNDEIKVGDVVPLNKVKKCIEELRDKGV